MRSVLCLILSLVVATALLAQVQVVPQNPHSGVITALTFSPDDKTLVTAGDDGYLKFWDVKTGLITQSLQTNDRINLLRYSPDGQMIAAADETNYQIDLYRLDKLAEPQSIGADLFYGIITDLAFSPDGRFLFAVSRDSTLQLIDLNQGKSLLLGYAGSRFLALSINEELKLAALDEEGILTIVDPDDQLSGTDALSADASALSYLSNSYDLGFNYTLDGGMTTYAVHLDDAGRALALYTVTLSGGTDEQELDHYPILAWSIPNPENSKLLSGHREPITDLKIYDQGRRLASLDVGGMLAVWDLTTGKRLFEEQLVVDPNPEILPSRKQVVVSADGAYAAVSHGVGVMVYAIGHRRVLWESRKRAAAEKLYAMDLSPDGNTLGLAFENGDLLFWDMNSLRPEAGIRTIDWPNELLNDFQFAPLEPVFAVAQDHGLSIWDRYTQRKIADLKGHFQGAYTLAFHPTQPLLVSSGDTDLYFYDDNDRRRKDTDLIFWDYNRGEITQQLTLGKEIIKSIAFEPLTGDYLLAAGENEKLWWLERRGGDYTLRDSFVIENSLAFFSPDARKLFVCDWNPANGQGTIAYSLLGAAANDSGTLVGHQQPIESFAFIPERDWLITGDRIGQLIWWDLQTDESILRSSDHGSVIIDMAYNSVQQLLYVASADGVVSCWDLDSKTRLYQVIFFNSSEFAFLSKTGDYAVDKRTSTPFAFQNGATGEVFPFEQFDLRYNRPDKLIGLINPSSSLTDAYHQAYQKRLDKLGFTEELLAGDFHLPELTVELENTSGITVDRDALLQIAAFDERLNLDRLNVFVNDVPIYGGNGIDLRHLNTKKYNTELTIPLSTGRNKIQLSVHNAGGVESMKTTNYLIYDLPEQKTDLYLITIGTSDYQAEGKDLQYAAKDAKDIAGLYQSAEGFGQVNTRTLTDEQVTKANIQALRQWLESTDVDDQVLLYVSGHGLLDDNYDFYYATHDIDFENPAEKGILYDEIEGLLDGIPARKKLLLMDACHSGEFDAEAPPLTVEQQESLAQKGISFEGFTKGDDERGPTLGLQNSFELMQQLFADLRRGSGATVISSSAGVQVSYEDAEWENGAFTYAFLYGLKSMKADANSDGQVTASEIQAFVAEYVPKLTEGLQVPTFRRENLEYDFRVW